ncbi:hypothetical protein BDZ94DRAFT_1274797, partial [Collybia nuda]
ASVSRSVANTILKAVQLIISMALHLIETALSSAGFWRFLVRVTAVGPINWFNKTVNNKSDVYRLPDIKDESVFWF